jgi:tRNA uridine 5-carbamoylmethylation protein Kti12
MKSTVIILDSSSYIKGYRYELHCISKAAQCRHCVVWCLTDRQNVMEWNESNTNSMNRYSTAILQELILRYEPPDERNRWDRPLYKIQNHSTTKGIATLSSNTKTDQDVLSQSVYNMHNLADAISTSSSNTVGTTTPIPATTTTITSGSSSSVSPAPVTMKKTTTAGSTFKRANLKRPIVNNNNHNNNNNNNTTTTASQNNTSCKTVQLTADALACHHQNHSSSILLEKEDRFQSEFTINNNKSSTTNEIIQRDDDYSTSHSIRNRVSTSTTTPRPTVVIDPTLSVQDQVDSMLQSLFNDVKALNEGTSTRQHVATNSDVLHNVDVITQQICSAIVSSQQQQQQQQQQQIQQQSEMILKLSMTNMNENNSNKNSSTSVIPSVPVSSTFTFTCQRPKRKNEYSLDDLRQLRTQYIQWSIKNPPEDSTKIGIAKLFIEYIEAQEL